MMTIQLFKDTPKQQSLEEPLEIIVSDMSAVLSTLIQVELKIINHEWTRIIITKEE